MRPVTFILAMCAAVMVAGPAEGIAAKAWLDKTLAPIKPERTESANLTPAEYDAFRQECAQHIIALKNVLGDLLPMP